MRVRGGNVCAAVVVVACAATVTRADPRVPGPADDASLRAVRDKAVRVELDNAPAVDGRVVAFEDAWLTVAVAGTNEIVSLPREHVVRVILGEATAAPLAGGAGAFDRISATRSVGVGFGVPGTLVVDVDYRMFHAFASPNVLVSILTASGE